MSSQGEERQDQAVEWLARLEPAAKVGSLHHTVPRFYLRRWADEKERVLVRDRKTLDPGSGHVSHISSLAIRDFYTSVNKDMELDARFEDLLGHVELRAAIAISKLLNPLLFRRRIPIDEKLELTQFMAFQLTRGVRTRRTIELQTDYLAKASAGKVLSPSDRRELTFVPHQNEHLGIFGSMAEALQPHLLSRPILLVFLDKPLLITCDEPVLLPGDGVVEHTDECRADGLTRAQRRSRRRINGEVIHFYSTRPNAVGTAEEIWMPLSPTALLVMGPQGGSSQPGIALQGRDAEDLAAEVNAAAIESAYMWVVSRVDDAILGDARFSEPGPLMRVCDGRSVMSENLEKSPLPRMSHRLTKVWSPTRLRPEGL